jgi:hypothetical protein
MENTTPFDLETAIEKWRAELAQSAAFKQENLNELESHLRDSTARLQSSGLSSEEAFWIATRRIGHGGALENEFGKMNRKAVWLQRVLWMLVGVQLWHVASGIAAFGRNALTISIRGASTQLGIPEEPFWIMSGVAVWLGAFAATIWLCWYCLFKKGDAIVSWIGSRVNSTWKAVLCFVALSLAWLVSVGMNIGTFKLLISSMPVQVFAKYQMGGTLAQFLQAPLLLALTFFLISRRRRVLRRS